MVAKSKPVVAALRGKETPPAGKKTGKGRGGARPGAGRKKGTATQKTREVANKLVGNGLTPLEHMMNVLREGREAIDKEHANGLITDAQHRMAINELNKRKDWAAQTAAPYMHPRLSSIELDTNAAEHESWLDELD